MLFIKEIRNNGNRITYQLKDSVFCLPQSNPQCTAIRRLDLNRVGGFRMVMRVEYHRLPLLLLQGMESLSIVLEHSMTVGICKSEQGPLRKLPGQALHLRLPSLHGGKVMFGV